MTKSDLMEKIIALAKGRGFIFPGSEIYGGLANSWDYGPLGVELKNNIKQRWWQRFVHQRDDMVGLDAALIMNPRVWEASGHVANFSDPLTECKSCHNRFRADELAAISNNQIPNSKCPQCGGELTGPRQFNLMFKTHLGPVESDNNIVYLRPETAQSMFTNFANILRTTRKRIPFGIAQVGRAFRNEITPGNFIFRTREFEQMEIEYFIKEKDWKKQFDHWLEEMKSWLTDLGIAGERLHYVEIPPKERAHYSKRTIDIEYDFPFGQAELYGLAYRTDFDLTNHMKMSGADLQYTDPETGEKFTPPVIEPTWGVERSVLAALLEAYHEEDLSSLASAKEEAPSYAKASEGKTDFRTVLRLPTWLAPIKVAILPLSKKDELSKAARPIYDELRQHFVCEYDETQSIGRRYRRQDEIGTPYCVTVDFESLADKQVTVRERDSMRQERVAINELREYLKDKLV